MQGVTRLKEAYNLIKAGHKQQAITILERLIQANPADAEAWALKVLAVDDPDQKRACLNEIIRLSSDQKALTWARQQLAALPPSIPDFAVFQPPSTPAPVKTSAGMARSDGPRRDVLYIGLAAAATLAVIIVAGIFAVPILRQRFSPAPTAAAPTAQPTALSQAVRPTDTPVPTSTASATSRPTRTPTDRPTRTATAAPTDTPGPTATLSAAQAHFEAGYKLYRHLWTDKALVEFNTALSLDPNLTEVYVVRARLYANKGLVDKSKADLAKAQALAPDDPAVMLLPGTLAWIGGDYATALPIISQVIAKYPNYGSAYGWRGRVYDSLGDFQNALADENKAIELDPNDFDAIDDKANFLYDNSDYGNACPLYAQAIRLDPEGPVLYANYGDCLLWGYGNLDFASVNYEESLKLYPDLESGHFGRAHIFYFRQKYSQALTEYNIADRLGINRAPLYRLRGLTFSHLLNYQRAVNDFTSLIAIEPDPCIYNDRCQAYDGLGNYKAAIDDCTVSINAGGPITAFYNRAVAYDQRGDVPNALSDYQLFLANYPADSEAAIYARERVKALGGTPQPVLACTNMPGNSCGGALMALAPPSDPLGFPHLMCEPH